MSLMCTVSRVFFSILATFCVAEQAIAQVISYEATSFPEDAGWVRRKATFPGDRWLDDGCLVQFTESLQPMPGGTVEDEEDFYDYGLTAWSGMSSFYMQWRIMTDGPSSAIPAVAPAFFGAGGFVGVLYHITMAEDKVRIIRDVQLPIIWADIAPGIPHTYRLELRGIQSYGFYIDGALVDAGSPEGTYPTSDSFLTFGARSPGEPAVSRWSYLRFGFIPQANSGDFDSSGVVGQNDLYFFVDCLLGPDYDAAGPGCTWADMNADGVANGLDIPAFTAAMLAS